MMTDSWQWDAAPCAAHKIEQRADDAQAEANQHDNHDECDATKCHLQSFEVYRGRVGSLCCISG